MRLSMLSGNWEKDKTSALFWKKERERKDFMKDINVCLTSVGRRGYLVDYFKKELMHGGKVIACNSDIHTTAMQRADVCYQTPLIYSDDYISTLLQICKKEKVSILLSLFDADLPVLAKHRADFAELGVKLVVSDVDVIAICNDKWKTQEFLERLELPTLLTSLDVHDERIKRALLEKKEIIIKPRWGMGSLAIYDAKTAAELDVLYKKVKADIEDSYLRFEAKEDRERCVLMQEKIEGEEFGLDVINDLDGNYITTIVRKKMGMRAGETDVATIVNVERLYDIGRIVATHLRHIGNLDMDVIQSNGQYYIIDMNARFGGGYPFSHMAGVNLPKAILLWARGEKANDGCFDAKIGASFAKDIQIVAIS